MESRERSSAIGVVAPIVILLFTFAVFFPTLAAGFVDLDDFALLIDNDKWRGLSWGNIKWMFTTTLLGHYQPLTWVSYALTFEFQELVEKGSGLNAGAYHFGNVAIHSVNAVLVYLVGMRLVRAAVGDSWEVTRVRLAAGVGAIVWAVHPLRVESVAWVTERRDVLSAMFLLGSLLVYLKMVGVTAGEEHRLDRRADQVGGTRIWKLYLGAVGLLVLSLLSKPWGMSFFVVLLVIDWYPLRRLPENPLRWFGTGARRVLLEKLPFAVLGVVFMVSAGTAANSAAMAMRTMEEWPLQSRVAQAAYGLVFYVRKSVVPTDLAVLYELRHGLNPFAAEYLVCYALIVLGLVGAFILRKRVPGVLAATIVYGVLVAPVLGFFQSGDQFVADRYSYMAMMGWTILFGVGVAWAVKWAERTKLVHAKVIAVGVGAIVLTAGVLTLNQSMVWRDSLALWEHAVQAGHGTPYVRVNYGLNLERKALSDERLDEAARKALLEGAVEQFAEASRLRPDDGKAAYCAGNTLRRLKRFEEAAAAYGEAAKVMPQAFQPLVNRGNTLINDLGRKEEGLASLRAAVLDLETPRTGAAARRQLSGMPYLALGAALKREGDLAGAREAFTKALGFGDSRVAGEGELKGMGAGGK